MKALLDYQCRGVEFLLRNQRALLADEPGCGKTVQAICMLNSLAHEHPDRPGQVCPDRPYRVLVVAPKSLVLNWKRELNYWLRPRPEGSLDLKVTNYERVTGDEEVDCLIVDEAHYVKNPEAKRTIAVRTVAEYATRVVLMTGTPLLNRPFELWSPLDILHPGRLGTQHEYGQRYCGGELKQVKRAVITPKMRRLGWMPRPKMAWDYSGASNLDELHEKLKLVMLRRRKIDVLPELPVKRRQVVVVPAARGAENDSDLLLQVTGGGELDRESYERVIARLQSLPVVFSEWSRRRHEQGLAKCEAVAEIAAGYLAADEKVVVMAHHRDVAEKLSELLVKELRSMKRWKAPSVARADGSMPIAARHGAVDAFQTDPDCRAFVGTINAAGVGITLHAASILLFAELDPGIGPMSQAEDRIHRIGQAASKVLVVHVVVDNTLDARLTQILVQKQDIADRVVDGR